MPLVIYGTHAHTHTHHTHARTHTHTRLDESDFKKPGARWPVAGVHLV